MSLSRHADSAADSTILGQADSAPEKVAPEWILERKRGRKRGGKRVGKKGGWVVGKGARKRIGKRGLEKGWENGVGK